MSHSDTERRLRRDARACFEAAIAAVEPARLVREFLERTPESHSDPQCVRLAGIGKAAVAMSRGAVEALGPRVAGGVLVTPRTEEEPPAGFELFGAGHPIPDEQGVAGSRAVRDLAESGSADDLLLVLISGGGSALMTLPPGAVTLADVQATTTALLEAGADIGELNAVRKHLDLLKGGRLAEAARQRVLALVLSDVVGDPLDVIASGPVSPDPTTFEIALEVLERFGLREKVPAAVLAHLERGLEGEVRETPKEGDSCFERTSVHVIGNNELAADAARLEAERRGYETEVTSTRVTGEARRVGAALAERGLEMARGARSAAVCSVSAGETTVVVKGSGKGGRNQEVALAAALVLGSQEAPTEIAVASLGTDGIDGPTDAAGAVATTGTLERAAQAGLDASASLEDNDAYTFFRGLDDLVITGPTGTNVMDVHLVMVAGR